MQIKFSHMYEKFPPNPSPSTLLETFLVDDDLSPEFVKYDTTIQNGGKYKLPPGKKIVLLLQTQDGDIWTTIRRFTDKKYEYYKSARGKVFDIVCEEENKSLTQYQ